jgi:hypothetical protein
VLLVLKFEVLLLNKFGFGGSDVDGPTLLGPSPDKLMLEDDNESVVVSVVVEFGSARSTGT